MSVGKTELTNESFYIEKSKRHRQRQTLSTEELMESAVFKRFITILDGILENAGDANMEVHSGGQYSGYFFTYRNKSE